MNLGNFAHILSLGLHTRTDNIQGYADLYKRGALLEMFFKIFKITNVWIQNYPLKCIFHRFQSLMLATIRP